MPRQARRKSESGIYHIMLRGINRQQIFEDEEDSFHFLETLSKYKEQCGYEIYGYCLMGNHINILIREQDRGRFCVLTDLTVYDIIFKGENYAKTSSQKKRKRNISHNAKRNQ